MERRFELRKEALLAECEVAPQVFSGVAERLAKFVEPFAQLLTQPAQREHTTDYLNGLMSDLERKSIEPIALKAGVPPRTKPATGSATSRQSEPPSQNPMANAAAKVANTAMLMTNSEKLLEPMA